MLEEPHVDFWIGTENHRFIARIGFDYWAMKPKSVILKKPNCDQCNSIQILTSRNNQTMDRDERRGLNRMGSKHLVNSKSFECLKLDFSNNVIYSILMISAGKSMAKLHKGIHQSGSQWRIGWAIFRSPLFHYDGTCPEFITGAYFQKE